MSFSTKFIALIAVIAFIIVGIMDVAEAQALSPALLACVQSLGGFGTPSICCVADVIEEATEQRDNALVAPLLPSLLNLCCNRLYPNLEPVCCVNPLIEAATPGSFIFNMCCGTTMAPENEEGCCGMEEFPSDLANNLVNICCSTVIDAFENEACCKTSTFTEIQRQACCPSQGTVPPACDPAANCSIDFNAEICCTPATITQNKDDCCSAGPTPGGNYEVEEQVNVCCSADDFAANEDHCCSLGLPDTLGTLTAPQCCSADNIEDNATFCCAGSFYAGREVECNSVIDELCSTNANGNRPTPEFDALLCCNNPNIPSTNPSYELACAYRACEVAFTRDACCVEALNPASTPWAARCSGVPPTPPAHRCKSSFSNLQRLNITNVTSSGDTTIGIINMPGRRRPNKPRSLTLSAREAQHDQEL